MATCKRLSPDGRKPVHKRRSLEPVYEHKQFYDVQQLVSPDNEERQLREQLRDIKQQYERLLQEIANRPGHAASTELPKPDHDDNNGHLERIELSVIAHVSPTSVPLSTVMPAPPLHSTMVGVEVSLLPQKLSMKRARHRKASPPNDGSSPYFYANSPAACDGMSSLPRRRSRRYRDQMAERRDRRLSAPSKTSEFYAGEELVATPDGDCRKKLRRMMSKSGDDIYRRSLHRQSCRRRPPDGVTVTEDTAAVTVNASSDATRFMEKRLNREGVVVESVRLERRGSVSQKLRHFGRRLQRMRHGKEPMQTLALF